MNPIKTTAAALMGDYYDHWYHNGFLIRMPGGRVLWEYVNVSKRGDKFRLWRWVPIYGSLASRDLYVGPEQLVFLIPPGPKP
jgi:hypothetical protein